MKKASFIFLLLLTISAFAQRPHSISPWSYLKDGYLDDALECSLQLTEKEPTKDCYKTWWYLGQVYQEISCTEEEKYKRLCDSCSELALQAYLKSIHLNVKDTNLKRLNFRDSYDIKVFHHIIHEKKTVLEDERALTDITTVRFPALANGFINEGVNAYLNKNFQTALKKFENAIYISNISETIDNQAFLYASLSAFHVKNWEKVVKYNEMLYNRGYGVGEEIQIYIFQNLGLGYLNTGDTAKFISTMEEGVQKFPENSQALVIELYNYYLDVDKEKALEYISMAIQNSPESAQFYVIRGTLYEKTNKTDLAKDEYIKAIEIEPENFDANYSLGAYYYNSAADTLEWANQNIPPTEMMKYDIVKTAADNLLKEALPYLEKAKELKPNDITVLSTLKTIYYRTGDLEKHDAIKQSLTH